MHKILSTGYSAGKQSIFFMCVFRVFITIFTSERLSPTGEEKYGHFGIHPMGRTPLTKVKRLIWLCWMYKYTSTTVRLRTFNQMIRIDREREREHHALHGTNLCNNYLRVLYVVHVCCMTNCLVCPYPI